jgi:hypothetical protein
VPYTNLPRCDTKALLARWGLKPIDVVNMAIAGAALAFSLYAFLNARAQQEQTELFGGYILGYTSTSLEQCEAGSMYAYAHCVHPVTNADFKSLDPILDSLLQIPIDWPPEQARRPGDIGFPVADPGAAPAIVTSALQAHYADQTVQNAFYAGVDVRWLLALSDDPAINKNSNQRTQYLRIAQQLENILKSNFGDKCAGLKANAPSHDDIVNLDSCLRNAWLKLPEIRASPH